ncbi:MAG: replication-relaxation family protein [Gammaproteobacteria bacterium]|nr:replication-relaxation family protein [Gammaproteobacteria bacterium]
MNIQLTVRDLALMQWINGVGFVTIRQIATWANVALPTAYARIAKLVAHGFLQHERVFHGAAGIYRVTLGGIQVSGSVLPPLRKIPLATYRHDLLVTSLSLMLLKKHAGKYIPERLLRHGEGACRVGQTGHMPDGVLVLGQERIAIEVELSTKGKRRLEKIFSQYRKQFDYQKVWYFCGSEAILSQITFFTKNSSFIECFLLSDFLNGASTSGASRGLYGI